MDKKGVVSIVYKLCLNSDIVLPYSYLQVLGGLPGGTMKQLPVLRTKAYQKITWLLQLTPNFQNIEP